MSRKETSRFLAPISAVAAGGALLLAVACGGGDPEVPTAALEASNERGEVATVDPASVPNPQASQVAQGSQVDLTQVLPGDVPQYPEVTPVRSIVQRMGRRLARFETADSPGQVQDFYLSQLPDKGWTIDSSSRSGGLRVVKATQDVRRLSVMIPNPEVGAETRVTVVVTEGS